MKGIDTLSEKNTIPEIGQRVNVCTASRPSRSNRAGSKGQRGPTLSLQPAAEQTTILHGFRSEGARSRVS